MLLVFGVDSQKYFYSVICINTKAIMELALHSLQTTSPYHHNIMPLSPPRCMLEPDSMRGSRGGAKGALPPPPLPTKYCSPK